MAVEGKGEAMKNTKAIDLEVVPLHMWRLLLQCRKKGSLFTRPRSPKHHFAIVKLNADFRLVQRETHRAHLRSVVLIAKDETNAGRGPVS